MKYTFSKEADKKIEKDMKFIVKSIKEKIPSVISIILTGGFSRGEGPVRKIKGKWIPYNDYDIQVLAKEKLSKERVDDIATEISKKLGYGGIEEIFYPFKKENQKFIESFYIDLKCDSPGDLKKLLPRIRNYELKNNSVILWGRDLRNLIPDYPLDKIPLSEGAKFLLDRMSQMIEYYSTKGSYDKEVLTYFIQQAYAACCTSLLLLNKKYQIGYNKSMKILKENYKKDFPELYGKIPDLHLKIEQFIKWKTNPKKLPNQNVEEEWFIAQNNILEVSKYFFSKFLGKKIQTLEELSYAILNMRRKFYSPYIKEIVKTKIGFNFEIFDFILLPASSLLLKYKYYKRLKILGINKPSVLLGKSPDLIIFSSLVYLIGAIDEEVVDISLLKKGKKILMNIYPCKGEN